jgi:hypothetical protein
VDKRLLQVGREVVRLRRAPTYAGRKGSEGKVVAASSRCGGKKKLERNGGGPVTVAHGGEGEGGPADVRMEWGPWRQRRAPGEGVR